MKKKKKCSRFRVPFSLKDWCKSNPPPPLPPTFMHGLSILLARISFSLSPARSDEVKLHESRLFKKMSHKTCGRVITEVNVETKLDGVLKKKRRKKKKEKITNDKEMERMQKQEKEKQKKKQRERRGWG